jgi:Asp/Glu/hydantoin racemase
VPTLAIIHTTPATVDTLKALAAEIMPGYDVVNIVDDSILPQLARNGGDLNDVRERLVQYARNAEAVGADVILEACSSVGEVVADMRETVGIPVVRIDEAMAEEAVNQGTRIGVAATLPTTLNPTVRQLEAKAAASGKTLEITTVLAETAYRKLMAGDREGHDADLVQVLTKLAQDVDVVVLAQASMARVIPSLSADIQSKFLSSPRMGMERVKTTVEKA